MAGDELDAVDGACCGCKGVVVEFPCGAMAGSLCEWSVKGRMKVRKAQTDK